MIFVRRNSKQEMLKMEVKKVRCCICAGECPMDVYVEEGKVCSIEGSKDTPVQTGALCVKGAAARQFLYNKERRFIR